MDWEEAVSAWSVTLRAAGRAGTTIATRTDHIRRVGRALGGSPWDVTGDDLLGYVGGQAWARETRRSVRSSLVTFYSWGKAAGYIGSSPAEELPAVAPGRPRARPTPERAYREALTRCSPRDRLILRLAGETGLRRAEIARIHADDVSEDLIGWSLLVHGKGGRQRVVPLPTPLALELRARGEGVFAFPGADGGHLSARWVGKIGAKALPHGWTLHSLRHRFATVAYGLDRDMFVVQELLGHASPVTTRRYVALDSDTLRSTVRRVSEWVA